MKYNLKQYGGPKRFSLHQPIVSYLFDVGGLGKPRDVIKALYRELGPSYFNSPEATLTPKQYKRFAKDVYDAKFYLKLSALVTDSESGEWTLSESKLSLPELSEDDYVKLLTAYRKYLSTLSRSRTSTTGSENPITRAVIKLEAHNDTSALEPERNLIPLGQEGILRESIEIQALLALIGATMGMQIWIPRSDKQRVLSLQGFAPGVVLDNLPLNYEESTVRTIEQIDVLWIKRRSIIRAFEVEHTTSIYSGILRMADLMALQPNLNISLCIVAPEERRDKVLEEIRRPVFAFMERGPLSENCTYLSYPRVREIAQLSNLGLFPPELIDRYAEEV